MARGIRHLSVLVSVALLAPALPAGASHTTPSHCDGTPLTPYIQRHFLGRTYIFGTPGIDVIAGTPEEDVIFGFEMGDLICGYTGRDRIYGGAGVDTIFGAEGPDRVSGGDGFDILDAGDGQDVCLQDPGEAPGTSCEVRVERPFTDIDRLIEALVPRP